MGQGGAAWRAVSAAQFVALGTYRRSGALVSAPIWLAPDGEDLVATSEADTGKTKRLRRDQRVVMQPCSRFGDVAPDAPVAYGRCVLTGSHRDDRAAVVALRAKYGRQFSVFITVERWLRRLQRTSGDRVILRISPSPDAPARSTQQQD